MRGWKGCDLRRAEVRDGVLVPYEGLEDAILASGFGWRRRVGPL